MCWFGVLFYLKCGRQLLCLPVAFCSSSDLLPAYLIFIKSWKYSTHTQFPNTQTAFLCSSENAFFFFSCSKEKRSDISLMFSEPAESRLMSDWLLQSFTETNNKQIWQLDPAKCMSEKQYSPPVLIGLSQAILKVNTNKTGSDLFRPGLESDPKLSQPEWGWKSIHWPAVNLLNVPVQSRWSSETHMAPYSAVLDKYTAADRYCTWEQWISRVNLQDEWGKKFKLREDLWALELRRGEKSHICCRKQYYCIL